MFFDSCWVFVCWLNFCLNKYTSMMLDQMFQHLRAVPVHLVAWAPSFSRLSYFRKSTFIYLRKKSSNIILCSKVCVYDQDGVVICSMFYGVILGNYGTSFYLCGDILS